MADPGQTRKATKEVIDALAQYCRVQKITHVGLFGGEPLLYKDLFRYCIARLKKMSPDIQLGMTTNGTLVDKTTLDLIKKQNISVLLSLDGDKNTHDRMRGGFDNILDWVMDFNDKSHLEVALQAGRVRGLYRNIKYIWDLDFASSVYVNVITRYGWYDQRDITLFEHEYEKAILGMLDGEGILTCALSMFDIIDKNFQKSMVCGISALGLAADWEGALYPCQRACELGKDFAIGDLWRGIDRQKNETIRSHILDEITHSESAKKYMVASYCPVSLYQEHHSFSGEWPEGFCRIVDIKAKLVAKYYYEIKEYYEQYQQALQPEFRPPKNVPVSEVIH